MSTDIGKLHSHGNDISVTRFFGGHEDGPCVQLTITNHQSLAYIQLTRQGVSDLIMMLAEAYKDVKIPNEALALYEKLRAEDP